MGTQGILEMNKQERERPLEVFVKASEEATGLVLSESWGDCPFSHRVLLMLETMRVPYKTYRIRHDEVSTIPLNVYPDCTYLITICCSSHRLRNRPGSILSTHTGKRL